MIRLNKFNIVCGSTNKGYKNVAVFLRDFLRKRSKVQLTISKRTLATEYSVFIVKYSDFERFDFLKKEKYKRGEDSIFVKYFDALKILVVAGDSERSLYFSVGKLLRNIHYIGGQVFIEDKLKISEVPEMSIRGQQLGYRPLNNTMDTWLTKDFESYIQDLILFGVNTINLISPNTDLDDMHAVQKWADHCDIPKDFQNHKKWPHIKLSYEDHLKEVSGVIAKYGLKSWLWYPNLGDFSKANLKNQLSNREKIFSSMAKLDVLFVPSGDPGELTPDELFNWLDAVYSILKKYHPTAKIWITLQSFQQAGNWLERMLELINHMPEWLGGVAHSPWQKIGIKELRKRVKKTLPIIHYVDITHNVNCQIPVKNWDKSYAIPYGRESINPRPKEFKLVHNSHAKETIGSVCYSEGVHDDINKFIFSDQDWNVKNTIKRTLRDYGNIFIKEVKSEEFEGFVNDLEANWNAPIEKIPHLEKNYKNIRKLYLGEVKLKNNYRFLMVYIRSISDLFIKNRYVKENKLLELCKEKLKDKMNDEIALYHCRSNLKYYLDAVKREALYKEILKISDKLYSVIGLQLSVVRHGNLAWNRGAFVDTLLHPITQVQEVLSLIDSVLHDKKEVAKSLESLKNFLFPDKDDICIEFKNHFNSKHVALQMNPSDHSCDRTAFMNYSIQLQHLSKENQKKIGFVPICWLSHVSTRFDTPLKIGFNQLHAANGYKMELTLVRQYFNDTVVSISLNDTVQLEKEMRFSDFVVVKTYTIKKEWIKKGSFELVLETPKGHLGPNVAEVKFIPIR